MAPRSTARATARQIVDAALAEYDEKPAARTDPVGAMPPRPDTPAWRVARRIVEEAIAQQRAASIAAGGTVRPAAEPATAGRPERPAAVPTTAGRAEPSAAVPPSGNGHAAVPPNVEPAAEPAVPRDTDASRRGHAPGPARVTADRRTGTERRATSETSRAEPSAGPVRWLVVSVLAAVALAWLLPLAVAAVRELLALS